MVTVQDANYYSVDEWASSDPNVTENAFSLPIYQSQM